ncbi:MAG: hypothetical protein FK734_10405 [Asgard group archaeon]|nr:hypothetical protein [Asgard group archaeon]
MHKKYQISLTVVFIFIILSVNVLPAKSVTLSLTDEINDIVHMVDGETVGVNIDVQPDIDITSLVINDTTIAITFFAAPILSIDNWYDFIVYWNGQNIQNFTDGHWNMGNIISSTKLVDSTGDKIVHTNSSDIIEVIGNTIYYPILNHSLIVTDLDPVNMIMDARHRTGSGAEFYRDVLEYNIGTESAPGYTIIISLVSLSAIIMILIIFKKKH